MTTLAPAIDIAHKHSLNLVGIITLASDPLVIKAVDVDRHLYGLRRRAARAASAKKGGGGHIGPPTEGVQVPGGHC